MRFVTHWLRISIASVIRIKKLKSSRICFIGYSGFISLERFLIDGGGHTHMHTYRPPGQKQFQETSCVLAFGWHAWFNKPRTARLNKSLCE